MENPTVTDLLREHPFTAHFWPDHVARLAAMASEARFAPGELIFHEGDHSSLFYLLISGNVALEVNAPGRPLRVSTLYAGEVLGWSSVTDRQRQAVSGARARRGPRPGVRWRPAAPCLRAGLRLRVPLHAGHPAP